ncbi:peptide/nickel transport system permease protein [Thermocatellispora tengchongensis]|uniref:Peptide/nickel transport system permease protein n=1 Tax=Thermocatellispora tengchongensis TaxID=1073253 RepID=A0A840PD44_9ACTN|nr:ABC transporter permease subunit [Thermocatellispora tengchongensis]MBB5136636.1 peptide/nickel transport system permease protein [Thermocatellispora tengchongensis]
MRSSRFPAGSWPAFAAAAVLLAVAAAALLGPLLAPHTATRPVGLPYAPPGAAGLLGTDHLGRDVLSRVLLGGLPVLATSAAGALAGSALGVTAGLGAALLGARRAWAEGALLRPLDAVAALPPLVVLLLALTALPGRAGIVLAVAVAGAPLSARVIRAAAAPMVSRGHVEAAVARGESLGWLLGRELLPLVAGPVLADAGLRFVMAVYLVTAAGFLGMGTGGTDWGVLIAEALPGAGLQPAALAAPVLLVAALGVSVNVLADEMLRRGRAVLA